MASLASSIPPPMPMPALPALTRDDLVLTVVLFKPDGRRARTLRLSPRSLLVAAVIATGAALAALTCGWFLGEWTALL